MTSWFVSAAKGDIASPLHIPELDFIPRQHCFRGVHDQLFAKALALEANSNAAIIVTGNAIGFHLNLLSDGRDFIAEFRRRVQNATGVASEAIILAASHAHSTPKTINLTPFVGAGKARPKNDS